MNVRRFIELLRHTRCSACGHKREDHWLPYSSASPCSKCECGGFRK